MEIRYIIHVLGHVVKILKPDVRYVASLKNDMMSEKSKASISSGKEWHDDQVFWAHIVCTKGTIGD